GFANIEMSERNGNVAASFVIEEGDELMMVTNGGKVIRMPTHDIRIAGRKTQGVTLFRTAEDEQVVAVERLSNLGDEDDEIIDGEEGVIEGAEGAVETADQAPEASDEDAAEAPASDEADRDE
ncbi:MAG: DNA gyrase subunit A, partial [Thalassospira sp.]|nr:DNA gyrase subunit A [Thalassospira sp.]